MGIDPNSVTYPGILVFCFSLECFGLDWDTNPNPRSRCWHHFDVSNFREENIGVAPGVYHYRVMSCTGKTGEQRNEPLRTFSIRVPLADQRGRSWHALPRNPTLSFRHKKSLKSRCVKSWRPLTRLAPTYGKSWTRH